MSDLSDPKLSINSWLQDELYQTYLNDRRSVDESWEKVFEGNGHGKTSPAARSETGRAVSGRPGTASAGEYPAIVNGQPAAPSISAGPSEELTPLRGVAAKIAENMTVSLTVPTATSQRMIPVRVLEENRQLINQHRGLAGEGKISYTHLISWAIVRGLEQFPSINDAYTEQDGQPFRLVRPAINMGIAVDVKGKDGSASLMVPNIKDAGSKTFSAFMQAFDDIVARARVGKLQMPDFQGTSISLTNPGTVGTIASVPRLVAGQGAIIATGAMDYPAEYQSVAPETRAALGISKVMMMTCTYDHRIIQGAESGRFLGRLQELLNGEDGFYEQVFADLGVPYKPLHWEVDLGSKTAPAATADPVKEAAVAHLINAYRVRGHFI
ncbi:MAG: 2-oxo acid dehydrogenase subunit E2, partial [Bryobacteraceae bacterium]